MRTLFKLYFLDCLANLTEFLLVCARQEILYNDVRRRLFTYLCISVEVGLRLVFRIVSFCEDPSDRVVML